MEIMDLTRDDEEDGESKETTLSVSQPSSAAKATPPERDLADEYPWMKEWRIQIAQRKLRHGRKPRPEIPLETPNQTSQRYVSMKEIFSGGYWTRLIQKQVDFYQVVFEINEPTSSIGKTKRKQIMTVSFDFNYRSTYEIIQDKKRVEKGSFNKIIASLKNDPKTSYFDYSSLSTIRSGYTLSRFLMERKRIVLADPLTEDSHFFIFVPMYKILLQRDYYFQFLKQRHVDSKQLVLNLTQRMKRMDDAHEPQPYEQTIFISFDGKEPLFKIFADGERGDEYILSDLVEKKAIQEEEKVHFQSAQTLSKFLLSKQNVQVSKKRKQQSPNEGQAPHTPHNTHADKQGGYGGTAGSPITMDLDLPVLVKKELKDDDKETKDESSRVKKPKNRSRPRITSKQTSVRKTKTSQEFIGFYHLDEKTETLKKLQRLNKKIKTLDGRIFGLDSSHLEIKTSSMKGLGQGLFPTKNFQKDEFVAFYIGKFYTDSDAFEKLLEKHPEKVAYSFDVKYMDSKTGQEKFLYSIDGTVPHPVLGDAQPCPATKINHSRTRPNLEFRLVYLQGKRNMDEIAPGKVGVAIFTLKAVSKGQEFFIDYGDSYHNWLKDDLGILLDQ